VSVRNKKAYAKINHCFKSGARRADGYHEVATVMHAVTLHDLINVRVTDGDGIRVSCSDASVPTDRRNTAYAAAVYFADHCRDNGVNALGGKRIEIHITKHIPHEAGLGGGSSDAAAVLTLLNRHAGEPFTEAVLRDIGARVGADVPFFIPGSPALCEGIGDIITPLPDLPLQFYVIVQPDFVCDTKKAYSLYKPNIKKTSANLFQDLYNYERIHRICEEFLQLGAESASLSGSGSAVFGIFKDEAAALSAVKKMKYPFKTIAHNK